MFRYHTNKLKLLNNLLEQEEGFLQHFFEIRTDFVNI